MKLEKKKSIDKSSNRIKHLRLTYLIQLYSHSNSQNTNTLENEGEVKGLPLTRTVKKLDQKRKPGNGFVYYMQNQE